MSIKLSLILLIACCLSLSSVSPHKNAGMQTDPGVPLPFIMKLPNSQWHLAVNEAPGHYIFKREPIKDAEGRDIIPAIMIYVEDASEYKQDVSLFWSRKMQPLTDNGVKVGKVLIQQDKDYPLSFKNAVFVTGTYTDSGVAHIIYMIYIIDKHNKGIQVYLDMTSELQAQYGQEFWTTVRSLKEVE